MSLNSNIKRGGDSGVYTSEGMTAGARAGRMAAQRQKEKANKKKDKDGEGKPGQDKKNKKKKAPVEEKKPPSYFVETKLDGELSALKAETAAKIDAAVAELRASNAQGPPSARSATSWASFGPTIFTIEI